MSWGPPTVVGGRIFVPSANRLVYSLNPASGCQYWTFESEAPARTAIFVAQLPAEPKRYAPFFADQKPNPYALDAPTGQRLWKEPIDPHPKPKTVASLQ